MAIEFRRCDAAQPPASELIAALLTECDGVPACGGGIKALAAGYREVADDNANPHADFWGEKPR